MTGGWVKLYRSMRDHYLLARAPAPWLKVWLYLLLSANFAPRKWPDGRRDIVVPRGCVVTSIDALVRDCHVTIKQARGALAYLTRAEMITRKTTPQYSLITMCNYDKSEAALEREGIPVAKLGGAAEGGGAARPGKGEGKPRATLEEREEEEEEEEEYVPSPVPDEASGQSATSRSIPTLRDPEAIGSGPDPVAASVLFEWFEREFWPAYFRKVDKAASFVAFKQHATSAAKKDFIVSRLHEHAPSMLAREKHLRPYAATWLNKRRYEEEPEAPEAPSAIAPGSGFDDYPLLGKENA
jgi:hypothetical protein